ncbi:hypothetical protein [Leptolyngbya sp. FACHB-16]|uniref:hypothetical protein n=1 Tax=unclassified Leptolyngbya TaxID=2650499 RepID=UPI0016879552|nr:hypothetical protein [Leptolyngbya sp. FACHB-16]
MSHKIYTPKGSAKLQQLCQCGTLAIAQNLAQQSSGNYDQNSYELLRLYHRKTLFVVVMTLIFLSDGGAVIRNGVAFSTMPSPLGIALRLEAL